MTKLLKTVSNTQNEDHELKVVERSYHRGVEVEIKRSKNKTAAVESAMRESRIKNAGQVH